MHPNHPFGPRPAQQPDESDDLYRQRLREWTRKRDDENARRGYVRGITHPVSISWRKDDEVND